MNTATSAVGGGLVDRALQAFQFQRATDHAGFLCRNNTTASWHRWARRARVARTIAAALDVPAGGVVITDDPQREYNTRSGPVSGDLITVTDPVSGRRWQFIPDASTPGEAWMLLGCCPGCGASVPVAAVAGLADLGDYFDSGGAVWPLAEACDDTLHAPGCVIPMSTINDCVPSPDRSSQTGRTQGDHHATT